jgi:5'-nucleotidase
MSPANGDAMTVLIDMDNTVVDFEQGFIDAFRKKFPRSPFISKDRRDSFYLEDQYPEQIVYEILSSKGFFFGLEPIPGSIAGIRELDKLGHDIRFCTSPIKSHTYCIAEKMDWIQKYFGRDWVRKTVITYDKALVRGHYLIDDKPEINSRIQPEWEHVLYDQPYNSHIKNKRRMTWDTWKELFDKPKKPIPCVVQNDA